MGAERGSSQYLAHDEGDGEVRQAHDQHALVLLHQARRLQPLDIAGDVGVVLDRAYIGPR